MQKHFATFRRITMTGLMFLVPLYVLVLIVTQAWTQVSSIGTRLATLVGLQAILGGRVPTVLSGCCSSFCATPADYSLKLR
jgi:hypothetical protein